MPIEGSFSRYLDKRVREIDSLAKETAKDGLREYEDSIKSFTPEGKTGKLKKTIDHSRVKRTAPHTFSGTVETNVDYARHVEYGTSPHTISPNKKAALSFTGVVAQEVEHPGAEGAHMFQRGTAEFRDMKLEPLMRKNLALYLAGGESALRIT